MILILTEKKVGGREEQTISLNTKVHLRLGRMGDGVTAEFDFGAEPKENSLARSNITVKREVCNKVEYVYALLHNRIPQRIAQSVTLSLELERSCGVGRAGQLSHPAGISIRPEVNHVHTVYVVYTYNNNALLVQL